MLIYALCCFMLGAAPSTGHYAAQPLYVDPSFILLHAACRSMLYVYSFLILLALYVVPSWMFLRALSCFMFNALLFHSVCRSVPNAISGYMQIHGLCYTFRDIAHAWCHSILYVFLCYILLRLLCCPIVYFTPFFIHRWTIPHCSGFAILCLKYCCIVVCWFMLSCFILCCFMLCCSRLRCPMHCCWRYAATSVAVWYFAAPRSPLLCFLFHVHGSMLVFFAPTSTGQ